jgi:hypothetical protein
MAASTTANSKQMDGAGAAHRSSSPMIAVYPRIHAATNTLPRGGRSEKAHKRKQSVFTPAA